jgi:choline dehydrogenase-like flavoprotein
MLNHPFSRGTCHISSPSIDVKPTWDPGFFTDPDGLDLEIVARHIRFVERLIKTQPFAGIFKPDGLRLPDIVGESSVKAEEIARICSASDFHPCGSCGMKPRELGGVVDDRLVVYGTKNLRVVDASIMPLVPTGNLQLCVYAIAEKAVDLIREDRK